MDTFNPNQMPPVTGETMNKKSSVGPLVAVIIILALIIIGGLYFLKERSAQQVYTPPQEQQAQQIQETDPVTASLNKQGSSDDLESIESDLKATNIDGIDQGAAAVEAGLQQ